MVMPTVVVLAVVLLALVVVLGCAYITRNWPTPPARDSELPSTDRLDGGPLLDTQPGMERVPWVNTVPSAPVPLDEAPWDRALNTMNAKERKP